MDFSETIEVKVIDRDDHFAVDSYFFAYFHNLTAALEQIRDAIRNYRLSNAVETGAPPTVMDTTAPRAPLTSDRSSGLSISESSQSVKTLGFRLPSIFRPFSDPTTPKSPSTAVASDLQSDDFTHVTRKTDSFVPITTSPTTIESSLPLAGPEAPPKHTQSLPVPEHTYPPSTSSSMLYPNHSLLSRESSSSWAVGVPSWLKGPRRVFGGSITPSTSTLTPTPVKEVYSSSVVSSPGPISRSSGLGDLTFSILETPDILPDQEITEKFRNAFAYDEKEVLLGCTFGHLIFGTF